MSESAERAAAAAAAEVSAKYIADMRLRVRNAADKLDAEIEDLIRAARGALALAGVLPDKAANESDPLVKQAVSTYVKAEFGLDNEDAEKYRASFEKQKIALALASDYIEAAEGV